MILTYLDSLLSISRKVGSCCDISDVSIIVLSVNFQRPDNILETNFSLRN